MIDYITGSICELSPTEVVIETGGIGYIALISLQTYSLLDKKKDVRIYIHHIIREDEELFYGFATKEEREIFRQLISVSGVGAATARVMLSSLSCDEIRSAIMADDVKRIQSIKGIGLKTAQRVIIELKDKICKVDSSGSSFFVQDSTVADEATTALILLGFTKAAVNKAVGAILKKNPSLSVESIIKQALQLL